MSRFVKLTNLGSGHVWVRADHVVVAREMLDDDGTYSRVETVDGDGWDCREGIQVLLADLDAALDFEWNGPAPVSPPAPLRVSVSNWMWQLPVLLVANLILNVWMSRWAQNVGHCLFVYTCEPGWWWRL